MDRLLFDRQTILLADDCEDDITIMQNALAKAEVPNPIQIVRDGQEAVAYLAGGDAYSDRKLHPLPAVVFLDLNMPKLGGLEVLTWLRQQPGLNLINVQIISASSRDVDITRAMELGANGYVIKPSRYHDLVDMLRAWHTFARFQALVVPAETP